MAQKLRFPRFISDKPVGTDCFKGRSQERLAHSICDYVKKADVGADGNDGEPALMNDAVPRIIGLEGGWGSGKSNVVSMIKKELDEDGYYTFIYDAWGHQEDLQRRSILETMVGQLVEDNVLQGNVEIQMRNGKKNNDSWGRQLSLLLSNKTTTIRKSTPKLTTAALWGIGIIALFAICSLLASQLIDNICTFKCFWWIDVMPIAVAIFVTGTYLIKDKGFKNIIRMVD